MKRTIIAVYSALFAFGVLVLPNLLWLTRSTVRVVHTGDAPVPGVVITVDDRRLEFLDLQAGERRFALLPESGDATLLVRLGADTDAPPACQDYVQGDMFHVEVTVSESGAQCRVSLPLLSELLILKLL